MCPEIVSIKVSETNVGAEAISGNKNQEHADRKTN